MLAVTTLAEIAGKAVLSQGLATSFRPRKYYTIPKESLEASIEDVEQLINFFVIEIQRVVFAENVAVSGAVSFSVRYEVIMSTKLLRRPLWPHSCLTG